MKRILICTGVLGGGTALVFAAAALAATIAPAGALVPGNFQQGGRDVVFGGRPLLIGNGGMITKVIGPDGSITLQNGPINNFGVVNVTGTTTVNIASDLPASVPAPAADPPVIVQPVSRGTP